VHVMIGRCAEIFGQAAHERGGPDVGAPTEMTSHEPPIR
jgi:hypothetical protein